MRAIVIVLTSFAICVGFVLFFAAFTQVPLVLLGIFVIATTSNFARRKPARAPEPAAGSGFEDE